MTETAALPPPPDLTLDETTARQLLLVRAFEDPAADEALWTAEDRAWASRLALQTAGADAGPVRLLAARAGHALQRLQPRVPAVGRVLAARSWRARWVFLALLLGALAGIATDSLAGGQRINLLAPPVWVLVVWNLAVYLGLLWQASRPPPSLPTGLGRWLQRRFRRVATGGGVALQNFAGAWARHSAPLLAARGAALLHLAAAALAAGLVAGLYLRGLVFDLRAGWESTFLDATTVQTLLQLLLAPAAGVTGVAVPEVAALRITAGGGATGSAAPWIHLYAALLALTVIAPRALLATAALWRARWLARHFPLPLDDGYYQRLLRRPGSAEARVQVLPYAAAPAPQAALGLQAVLAGYFGATPQLQFAAPTAFGDEEAPAAAAAGTGLRVVLFDLAATPEAESQGRFVQQLQTAPTPLLLVADETGFRQRFGSLPGRLAERRAAWQGLADGLHCGLLCVDLAQPDLVATEAALHAALDRSLAGKP